MGLTQLTRALDTLGCPAEEHDDAKYESVPESTSRAYRVEGNNLTVMHRERSQVCFVRLWFYSQVVFWPRPPVDHRNLGPKTPKQALDLYVCLFPARAAWSGRIFDKTIIACSPDERHYKVGVPAWLDSTTASQDLPIPTCKIDFAHESSQGMGEGRMPQALPSCLEVARAPDGAGVHASERWEEVE